jgi:chloramphenicol 3-O-phosphotransferase
VILWLNGPFGGGKTSTAEAIAAARPEWRVFDPEMVGYFLRAALPDLTDVDDFQDWPAWRPLVTASLHEIAMQTGQHLVAPQSVLDEHYFTEIVGGLTASGHLVVHVLLDAPEDALRQRIEDVEEAREWRLAHLPVYLGARAWMTARADLVLDTSAGDPTALAQRIIANVGDRA